MAIIGLEIERREPVLGGASFGAAGAYEKIAGVVRFAVDPRLPVHAPIADIEHAPRNARGLVESHADFYLLRPVGGGNRRLLLDVPNRGRKIALGMLNSAPRSNDPTSPEDFGNGFLMRHGFTVAWTGWQPDVPRQDGLLTFSVPRVAGAREAASAASFVPTSGRRPCRSPTATTFRTPPPTWTIRRPS